MFQITPIVRIVLSDFYFYVQKALPVIKDPDHILD